MNRWTFKIIWAACCLLLLYMATILISLELSAAEDERRQQRIKQYNDTLIERIHECRIIWGDSPYYFECVHKANVLAHKRAGLIMYRKDI